MCKSSTFSPARFSSSISELNSNCFLYRAFGVLLLCLFVSIALYGSVPAKEVPSRIQKVVVFLNGAQVIRNAQTTIPAGRTQLAFKQISPLVRPESIQVKGEGAFTILSVVHQLDQLQEQTKRSELTAVEEQLEKVKDQLAREQTILQVYRTEEAMLTKNQEVKGQNLNLKVTDLKEAVVYQRARLTEVKLKQLATDKNIRQLIKTNGNLEQQLQNLNAEVDVSTSEIVVNTMATAPIPLATFTLSYVVEKASWYPTYDVRVKDIASPLTLLAKANVNQQCGENWTDVKLTLSTGNPALTGVKPQLDPWLLNYNIPRPAANPVPATASRSVYSEVSGIITDEAGLPLPGVTVLLKGTSAGTSTNEHGRYTLSIPATGGSILTASFIGYVTVEQPIRSGQINFTLQPDARQLQEVATVGYAQDLEGRAMGVGIETRKQKAMRVRLENATASIPVVTNTTQNQTSVSFDIVLPYTIPSDGKNYTVEIKEQAIPALYEYICAPKLDLDAFLTAKILNWEEYNLLEGEASLFFEGTFMGKTLLNPNSISDTLELSLGRDKSIVITRIKQKEQNKRQLLGSNRIDHRALTITARNKKNQAVTLLIQDQIPVSAYKEIEVARTIPSDAEYNEETGQLTWRFNLKPAQDKKLNFKYAVKYPKYRQVILD